MLNVKKYKIIYCVIFLSFAVTFITFSCLPATMPENDAFVLSLPLWLCLILLFAVTGLWIAFGIIAVKSNKKTGYAILALTAILFITCICIAPSVKSGIILIRENVTTVSLIMLQILCLYGALVILCYESKIYSIIVLTASFAICIVWIILAVNNIPGHGYLNYTTNDGINLLFEERKGLQNSTLTSVYQQKSLFVYEVIKEFLNNEAPVSIAWLDKNIEYTDGGFLLKFENFIEKVNYLK